MAPATAVPSGQTEETSWTKKDIYREFFLRKSFACKSFISFSWDKAFGVTVTSRSEFLKLERRNQRDTGVDVFERVTSLLWKVVTNFQHG